MFARFLSGLGKTMISFGLLIFLFVAFQLWGTGFEESRHQKELTSELADMAVAPGPTTTAAPGSPTTSAGPRRVARKPQTIDEIISTLKAIDPSAGGYTKPAVGQPLGIMVVDPQYNKAGISIKKVFVEGTDKEDLKKGPGHYAETPVPGGKGNAAIAGHRTTYGAPFNRINELSPGDKIFVYTGQGSFTYEVMPPSEKATGETGASEGKAYWVVDPEDSWVLEDFKDNRLTLTACHPEFSAAQRSVVAAKLTGQPAPDPVKTSVAPSSKPTTTTSPATPTTAPAQDKERLASAFGENLGWNRSELSPTLKWAAATFGVWAVAFAVGFKLKRKRLIGYLIASPLFFYCLWFTYSHLDRFIPAQ